MNTDKFVKFRDQIQSNVSQVIVGKSEEIDLIMTAFLAGGHVLIEDVPGMGKTMMIKAFSKSIEQPFKRIQFTPDLLPSDITGINFFNQQTSSFEFRKGPLFSNIVLADEINRATPRTQSSLLEAMEEKQITVDGDTKKLNLPFMVLATQNPVESYGTFPLPEAQLDRFLLRIKLGYPQKKELKEIIKKNIGDPLDNITDYTDKESLAYLFQNVSKVSISEDVMEYLVNVVGSTRNVEEITIEVSPRGAIALFKSVQAYAAIMGRDYIIPEDIRYMAPYVFNHRIKARGVSGVTKSIDFIKDIIATVPVPVEKE